MRTYAVDPHVVVLFGATGDLAETQADSRPGLSGPVRAGAPHRDRRHVAGGHLHRGVPRAGQGGGRRLRHPQAPTRNSGRGSPRRSATCRRARARGAGRRRRQAPRTKLGPDVRRLHYLSVPPKAARAGASPCCEDAEPGRAVPGGDGEAVRHRPGQRRRTQRLRARDVRRAARSSGSTTSSARRPRRTSWRSGSPTGCSSRSGTATSSTTSRSTSPRRWAWTSGPTSTRAPAPTRTWSSPTCSR